MIHPEANCSPGVNLWKETRCVPKYSRWRAGAPIQKERNGAEEGNKWILGKSKLQGNSLCRLKAYKLLSWTQSFVWGLTKEWLCPQGSARQYCFHSSGQTGWPVKSKAVVPPVERSLESLSCHFFPFLEEGTIHSLVLQYSLRSLTTVPHSFPLILHERV